MTKHSGGSIPYVEPKYETSEERIAYIARRWNTQYNYDAEYRARGWSNEEIAAGNKLGEERNAQHEKWRRMYGSPEYGGWDRDPADGVNKPQEVIEAARVQVAPITVYPATPASIEDLGAILAESLSKVSQ